MLLSFTEINRVTEEYKMCANNLPVVKEPVVEMEGYELVEIIREAGSVPTKTIVISEAEFCPETFETPVSLHNITFRCRVDFGSMTSGATFKEEVDFSDAMFEGCVYLGEATFKDKVDFRGAMFKNTVRFDNNVAIALAAQMALPHVSIYIDHHALAAFYRGEDPPEINY